MVKVDRRSGRKVFAGEPGNDPKAGIIWEAFKPDTEPRRTIQKGEIDAKERVLAAIERVRLRRAQTAEPPRKRVVAKQQSSDFVQEQGGIY